MPSREAKLLQWRTLEVLNTDGGQEPDWSLINRCPIRPILGAEACESCETHNDCWGKDFDLDLAPDKEAKVKMTPEDQYQATYEGAWFPNCPYCKEDTPAEPNVFHIECQTCGNIFEVENPY